MTIKRREVPRAVHSALAIALRDLISSGTTEALGGVSPTAFTQPIPLYSTHAAYKQDSDGPASEEFEQYGWRTIALDERGQSGFADVEGATENVEFARLSTGPQVLAFLEAAHLAERTLTELADVELRIVEAPELRIAAIWLHGDQSSFIPYQGYATKVITEAQFRDVLKVKSEASRDAFNVVSRAAKPSGFESM